MKNSPDTFIPDDPDTAKLVDRMKNKNTPNIDKQGALLDIYNETKHNFSGFFKLLRKKFWSEYKNAKNENDYKKIISNTKHSIDFLLNNPPIIEKIKTYPDVFLKVFDKLFMYLILGQEVSLVDKNTNDITKILFEIRDYWYEYIQDTSSQEKE